jgi:glycosyltransferase involved in cell wall biosynthesis
MKILYFITKSNWGGAQKYVYDLATHFKDNGEEVIVAFGGKGILAERLHEKNIKRITINNLTRDVRLFRELDSIKEIANLIRKEKPDTIHLNSSKVSLLGAFLGRVFGVKKIIFTAHGFPFREERPFWQILIIKFLTWLTIIFSHKTICVSEKDFKDVENWLFVRDKLVVIHNGLKKEEESASTERKLDNFIKIVSIAELHKNKGLEYGIRTIALLKNRLQNFKYTIFTFGGDEEFSIRKEIKDLDLENFIEIKFLEKNEKVNLKESDIYFLPSIKEGLPYVLLEAGINSLPMVASDTGGVNEVVENYKNGFLIKPKDINAFELSLEKLILDHSLRKSFGIEAKNKIIKEFLFEDMVKKVEIVYK